jgi:uridine kinase
MQGDKLIIEQHHTARAADLVPLVEARWQPKFTISIAGESGCGKSELAFELARLLTENGKPTGILQQDDYFVFPPRTNHAMRKLNLEQVGTYEVKLDFLDSNLRSFKRDESEVYKPLVYYEEDRIDIEEMKVGEFELLIAEGTYTSLLKFIDFRIFIDRDFRKTLEARKRRGRDTFEPFIEDVLRREHDIISQHRDFADVIVPEAFDRIIFPSIEDL